MLRDWQLDVYNYVSFGHFCINRTQVNLELVQNSYTPALLKHLYFRSLPGFQCF